MEINHALEIFPKLDLHGEYTTTVYTVIHAFLLEQWHLKKEYVVLVHGKGTGKLKEKVHLILKQEPLVLDYHLDIYNLGQTIVKLRLKKD